MTFQQILKDSSYNLDLFTEAEKDAFEATITTRDVKGKTAYYAPCLIRGKEIKLKPEEVVRQLYLNRLLNEYGYPKHRIEVEYAPSSGFTATRSSRTRGRRRACCSCRNEKVTVTINEAR